MSIAVPVTSIMPSVYADQILRAFRQAPWRKQVQTVAVLSIALLIIAVVGGFYLAVASRAGTTGRDLQRLEARKAALIQENDELRAELAGLRSVTRLADRARELGFMPAQSDQVEYLSVSNYPHPVASGPPAQSAAPRASTASPGDWLAQQLRGLATDGGG